MNIYLIRHGQTDWNTAGKIQGSTDIPLNETGRLQARMLAEGMKARPVVRIFSSTLGRAMETAGTVGRMQQVEVEPVEGLEEVGFGKWEGMTWADIQDRYPEEYRRWCLNPVEVSPPGGELQVEIRRRCKTAVDTILEKTNGIKGDIAIVSHGATLAYMIEYLTREDPLEEEIIVNNVSITTIHYSPLTGDFQLLDLNNTDHLR